MTVKSILEMKDEEISYENLKKRSEQYSWQYRLFLDAFLTLWFSFFLVIFFMYPIYLFYITFYTRYWFLTVLYYAWMYYDRDTPHTGGRKLKLPKPLVGEYIRDYFPIAMIKTVDLPANKNYIFCTYPHALLCMGSMVNFVHEPLLFKKLYPQLNLYSTTLSSNYFIPLLRDMMLVSGVIAVSERAIVNLLNNKPNSGIGCNIIIGGAVEAFYSDSDEYKIVLKNRKGFVRVALKTGASLVPVFCFGENETFDQVRNDWLRKYQEKIYKATGYAPVFPIGRKFGSITTVYPRVSPIITVVGRPLDLPKIENPTREQIDKYHQMFKEEIYDLFERYKGRCDPKGNEASLSYI